MMDFNIPAIYIQKQICAAIFSDRLHHRNCLDRFSLW